MITLPPDPTLKDLQIVWESQFWTSRTNTYRNNAWFYENWFLKFFGKDRRPRDIFRSDVAAWREWLEKKGYKAATICHNMESARRFYRLLNERELIEKDWNPFEGMSPKRVRLGK